MTDWYFAGFERMPFPIDGESAMALVPTPFGFFYPGFLSNFGSGAVLLMDATAERVAFIGQVYMEGRSTAGKTFSAAGGGTISWRAGAVTFANAGTTLDIGIQGVASGAGPAAQPDGSYVVSRTFTGGGAGPTANAWNNTSMAAGTGSTTITHGDLIAVVWDMTARAGADQVNVTSGSSVPLSLTGRQRSGANSFTSGAWGTTNNNAANVVLTMDDGTLAILDFAFSASTSSTEAFQDSTNPDERGMIFQVPWSCKVDSLWFVGQQAGATSDFTIKLYSDPTGTPSLLASLAVPAEQMGSINTTNTNVFLLPTEISLTKNTDYIVSVLGTGAGNIGLNMNVLGNTDYRKFLPGSTTLAKATRNNSTGAFTAETPAITMYSMGVRISQLFG